MDSAKFTSMKISTWEYQHFFGKSKTCQESLGKLLLLAHLKGVIWFPTSVRRLSVRPLYVRSHISKNKQEIPIVTMKHY